MTIPTASLGPVGAIPVIGPIILGVIGVVSILTSLLGITFGNSEVAQLATAVQQLQNAVAVAVQQATAFIWTVAYALGKILQWLHDAFVGFFTLLWNLLKQLANWIKNILADILPKILNVIQRIRQFLNMIYLKYIRPILVWLQYARQFLAILRLFHIAWATKLDNFLVQLQGRIIGPFLYVLRSINGIGTWVNLIITAQGIIQRAVFINTMYAYQGDWVPMWWVGQTSAAGSPPPPAVPQAYPALPASTVTTQLQAFTGLQASPYSAALQQSFQAGLAVNPSLTIVQ